jgi:hypothetical protein
MAAYALLDKNGIIANVIAWDGVSDWTPPAGMTVQPLPDGVSYSIGYRLGEAPPLPTEDTT